nr:hypothetical protein [Spelaeicoccus albus]
MSGLARTPVARRFERTNHRGEPVTMLEGPAFAVGALAGTAAGAALTRGMTATGGRTHAAAMIATAGAATFGVIDDLAESRTSGPDVSKGLRGHLGALRRGSLTTGGAKVLGISAAGIAAAALAVPRRPGQSAVVHWADVLSAGGVVAGAANLVNLLDLRPGRALKAVAVASAVGAAPGCGTASGAAGHRDLLAACVGAGAAVLPGDLGERSMLGDAGANAAGALLGVHVIATAPRSVRLAVLAAIAGATVASEKVSFTAVIARTPVLRELDGLGRRTS